MAFALFFLAISTVVFTTSKNWKDEANNLKSQVAKLQQQKNDADAERANAEAALKAAQEERDQQIALLNNRIADVEQQNQQAQQALTEQRETVARAQETAQVAIAEAEARRAEAEQLREILASVQQQANEFKLRQTELNDEIRVLSRQLETAEKNNKELRERVGLYSNVIRRAGLSDDVNQIRGVSTAPPDVTGRVLNVSSDNRRVVISIGSDDGLVVGHELEVWRTSPSAEYLGRIRLQGVDPNRASATLIGQTVQGKKIQEGDLVSSKIRPGS
jgi:chromosome segregation ATPase